MEQNLVLCWIGITISLMHSAMFSGLNLGFFGLSRLKLVVQAETGDADAKRILSLRRDAHFLLTTLLWGNVASNVLLALISDSIMTGISAFLFSTIGITFFGEIMPQAYFARHILRTSRFLVPLVRFYQILLYPVAKPSGLLLDKWLGRERILYFREDELEVLLQRHAKSGLTDLEHLEMLGAVNFLRIDDILIEEEGETVNPKSIIQLAETDKGLPIFPEFSPEGDDVFLQKVNASDEKWVIITDKDNYPRLVLNADQFLRDVMFKNVRKSIYTYCHRPIVVTEPSVRLGQVMLRLKVHATNPEDDVVDKDIILYWNKQKRIITGADILGRLLRGIVNRQQIGIPSKRRRPAPRVKKTKSKTK